MGNHLRAMPEVNDTILVSVPISKDVNRTIEVTLVRHTGNVSYIHAGELRIDKSFEARVTRGYRKLVGTRLIIVRVRPEDNGQGFEVRA